MRCLHSRKTANTAFRQQPHATSRLLDCAPLFESETSVCTLVPANPEYYAGGSTVGGEGGEPNSPQGRAGRLERDGEVFTKEKRSANSQAKRNICTLYECLY